MPQIYSSYKLNSFTKRELIEIIQEWQSEDRAPIDEPQEITEDIINSISEILDNWRNQLGAVRVAGVAPRPAESIMATTKRITKVIKHGIK